MAITPQNVVRHELIGLTVEVVKSRNNAGLKGKIVDESYKTLVINGIAEGGLRRGLQNKSFGVKRVFKDAVTITLTLPSKERVEVEGNLLVARPWDRIKRKLPKW
ncbi:MAG: ribonuclease P protein subunit [DPANN group archaeon]|nr:ribonuclease P protein subunit [DPANN group archaeon]